MKNELTPKEYADLRGITLQAVTKMIREKGKLPGIAEIKKYGRFYLLVPDKKKLKLKNENNETRNRSIRKHR